MDLIILICEWSLWDRYRMAFQYLGEPQLPEAEFPYIP